MVPDAFPKLTKGNFFREMNKSFYFISMRGAQLIASRYGIPSENEKNILTPRLIGFCLYFLLYKHRAVQ